MKITEDRILDGRLRLRQPQSGHRFGHDAVLLAAAVAAAPNAKVVEFGSGVGAAGLALLARVPNIELMLAEIEPPLVALAAENIALNGFSDRARAVNLDVTGTARDFSNAGILPGNADVVLMNPPFNGPAHQRSPDRAKRRAHAADGKTLTAWIRAASRALRPAGCLTLIWRAEELAAVLAAMQSSYGDIAILPVHPTAKKAAIRILVKAIKGGKGPLALAPAFILNGDDGRPTPQSEMIFRKMEALPFPAKTSRSRVAARRVAKDASKR